jgi:arylsulfatase A-like enzyme
MRLVAAVLALLFVSAGEVHAAGKRPNVLFLFSDDQRFDTIAALGNRDIHTPNLDKLVRNGFAFTHAFIMGSTMPAVCAPSRAMMLTGRTLYRAPINVPAHLTTWPAALGKAGYATFAIGKWHNGRPAFARSFSNGDAIFFGGMHAHDKVPVYAFDPSGRYAGKPVPGSKFSSELFADSAIKFLRGHKGDRPFALYVAFTAPHDPRTPPAGARRYDPERVPVPDSFMPVHPFDNGELKVRDEHLAPWPRTPAIVRRHLADYYGMISHLDEQIGRILKALEDSGRDKDTLIVFAGDNGLAVGKHGLMGKQNLYDHSVRVPLIFAGPGVPRARKSSALVYLFDVYPTLCGLTGVAVPKTVEGESLVPIMTGKKTKVRDSVFGAYREVQRMVRTERWKLIRYPKINRTQLFDVQADAEEALDLSGEAQYAGRVAEMMKLLRDWQKKAGDDLPLTAKKGER